MLKCIFIGCTMAQDVSLRLLTAEALVQYQVVNMWIVVDKIALGLVFLRVLPLPLSIIIPPIRGWYNAALVAAVPRDCVALPHPSKKKQWIFIILNKVYTNLENMTQSTSYPYNFTSNPPNGTETCNVASARHTRHQFCFVSANSPLLKN